LPVANWLITSGSVGKEKVNTVCLSQKAKMKMKPGQKTWNDEGTMQRFLGEIVWFSSAALSPYISWEAIDDLSAKAKMEYKGTIGSGTFYCNKQGDFVKYSAQRYKAYTQKHPKWIALIIDSLILIN